MKKIQFTKNSVYQTLLYISKDSSVECLHLDSLDNQLKLDVLVLFGPYSKAGGRGTVSQSLRKPAHWEHNWVSKVRAIKSLFFNPLVAFNTISPSTDTSVLRKVPAVFKQHVG